MSDAASTLEPAQRVVVRRAERVPLPRRLLAMALLFGILAIVLNALPRPYKPIPTLVVYSLGTGFDDTRTTITAADKDEIIAGEATPEERKAYQWELWRHSWGGIARELGLRTAFLGAGLCLFGSAGAAAREFRRSQKAMQLSGARLKTEVVRTDTIEENAPPPLVLPKDPAPLLPAEPLPPIRIDAPGAPVVTGGKPDEVDPALAKLGFTPMKDPPKLDDEDRSKPANLAARTTTTTASAPVTPPPAEPSLPIGTEVEARLVVKPGTPPPVEEPSIPETTIASVSEPSVEKTVPSPEPSVETTVPSQPVDPDKPKPS